MHVAVINPNSNAVYTEHISRAVDALRRERDITIDCMTLSGAPLAIQTDQDIDDVVDPLCTAVERLDETVDGVVIACFADPGLREVRALHRCHAVGSCEAAVAEAQRHGSRIGLISTGDDVEADRELMLSYAAAGTSIVVENLGIPTAEIPVHASTLGRMVECGLVLQRGEVSSVVLGCAGMACHAGKLREELDVPVIEPVSSAVNTLLSSLNTEEVE